MFSDILIRALKEAIRFNELGNASPYQLSYARLGSSGASFGVFQGDTNVNSDARATLLKVLEAANLPGDTCTSVLSLVSRPCPGGDPLEPPLSRQVNDALANEVGRPLVDAMDEKLLAIVREEIGSSITAAAQAKIEIDPVAILYIGLWVNMTGTPTTLNRWLTGTPELGLIPPTDGSLSPKDMEKYLGSSSYFQLHP